MRWPWNRGMKLAAPVVDTHVAERLEQVASRLERVAAELAAKVEQYRQEEIDDGPQ